MFSFSLRWLWAQSLVVSAGFFLLGYLAMPTASSKNSVAGLVKDVAVISRKGLGSYYELTLRSDGGEPDRILMARDIAEETVVRGLIGHRIAAHVNWSSVATDVEVEGSTRFEADSVRRSAESAKVRYDSLSLIFAGAGMAIGLLTFAIGVSRQDKSAE